LIGRRGPYPGACSGNFTTTEKVVSQLSDRGMDHASIINFLSNEDTQELAPGFFIIFKVWVLVIFLELVFHKQNPKMLFFENIREGLLSYN
jgi:hypothetical protein